MDGIKEAIKPPAPPQQPQVAVEGVAADDVEDHVDAFAAGRGEKFGDEIPGGVVHRPRRPEAFAGGAFFGPAAGRIYRRPERRTELDRRRADAATAAVDQQPFAGLQRRAAKDIVPDREERLRQRCRLRGAKGRGDRQRLWRGHDAIFGVAAAGDQRRDRIADPPAARAAAGRDDLGRRDDFTDRDDLAGEFEAGNVGDAFGRRIQAPALQHVGAVDPRRRHPHQQLVRARRGHRPRAGDQRLQPAGGGDFDRRHRLRQRGHGLVVAGRGGGGQGAVKALPGTRRRGATAPPLGNPRAVKTLLTLIPQDRQWMPARTTAVYRGNLSIEPGTTTSGRPVQGRPDFSPEIGGHYFALIAILRTPLPTTAFFGTVTVITPLLNSAAACSTSAPAGSWNDRRNDPLDRSTRW